MISLDEIKKELSYLDAHGFTFDGMVHPDTALSEDSELNPKHYTISEILSLKLVAFKVPVSSGKPKVLPGENSPNIFVNGILTTLSMAKYQRDYLSNLIGQPVDLIYNPTNGAIYDLIECARDRVGMLPSEAAVICANLLKEKLKNHGKVRIFGYSQGGILCSRALSLLSNMVGRHEMHRIEFFSFAAGFRSFETKGVYAEHFANTMDPVSKIGVLSEGKTLGKIFTRDEKGHLLVGDYLKPIKDGEFGTKSRFYHLCSENMSVAMAI